MAENAKAFGVESGDSRQGAGLLPLPRGVAGFSRGPSHPVPRLCSAWAASLFLEAAWNDQGFWLCFCLADKFHVAFLQGVSSLGSIWPFCSCVVLPNSPDGTIPLTRKLMPPGLVRDALTKARGLSGGCERGSGWHVQPVGSLVLNLPLVKNLPFFSLIEKCALS